MLPLVIKRQLKSLTIYSFLGFSTLFYIMVVTIMSTFNPTRSNYYNDFRRVILVDWKGCMFSFPVFIFSFTTQINLLQCFEELEKPTLRRMHKVLAKQHFLCFSLYLFIGVFGYLSFPIDDGIMSSYIQRYNPIAHMEILVVVVSSFSGCGFTYFGHLCGSTI